MASTTKAYKKEVNDIVRNTSLTLFFKVYYDAIEINKYLYGVQRIFYLRYDSFPTIPERLNVTTYFDTKGRVSVTVADEFSRLGEIEFAPPKTMSNSEAISEINSRVVSFLKDIEIKYLKYKTENSDSNDPIPEGKGYVAKFMNKNEDRINKIKNKKLKIAIKNALLSLDEYEKCEIKPTKGKKDLSSLIDEL